MTAQILSYMEIAQKYSKVLEYKKISLKVPEPEAFILHKILIYPLRGESHKKQKDIVTVANIFDVIVENQESLKRMKEIFIDFPKKMATCDFRNDKERFSSNRESINLKPSSLSF